MYKRQIERYTALLFFGLMNVTKKSDALLARRGLWRNHHRVLDTLSRGVARSLSDLAERNGTSKQALHKSIQGLLRAGLVQVEVDPLHRRAKSVKLTPAGRRFEALLDDCQHTVFREVTDIYGKEKMEIWAEVMEAISTCLLYTSSSTMPAGTAIQPRRAMALPIACSSANR